MAPDENNPGGWEVPAGFTLTRIPAHQIDHRAMEASGSTTDTLAPDGSIRVLHFFPEEPYVWKVNDGTGPNASDEAKRAALAGTPLAGWSPHCVSLPIEGGWVPDQYVLTHDDDPTPKIEPASVLGLGRELTPDEEVARLEAAIAATQARIDEIKGAQS